VNLFQKIPAHLEESWVCGKVCVALQYSVFTPSSGWQHYSELALQILQTACDDATIAHILCLRDFAETTNEEQALILKWVPCYIFLNTDVGHDHNNTLVQNQCASLAFVVLLKLVGLVNSRNAPDGSWINSVERVMQLLNLALAHQSYAHKEWATLEGRVHDCNSMKHFRQIGGYPGME
jgi:hypothetical protein